MAKITAYIPEPTDDYKVEIKDKLFNLLAL